MLSDDRLEQLRAAGSRPTAARLKILALMESLEGELLGADALYNRLVVRGTPVDPSSVYRIVRELEAAGILLRDRGRNGKSVYGLVPADCRREVCRMMCAVCCAGFSFSDVTLVERLSSLARQHGLVLSSNGIAIQATCEPCRARHGAERGKRDPA